MNTIVNMQDFKGHGHGLPMLVLVDMHYDLSGGIEGDGITAGREAIANCRKALQFARSLGVSVAFTRQVTPSINMFSSPVYPRWLPGFEPSRRDMIFDRQRPSCYTSTEFRSAVDAIGGKYVIAGHFAELSCLSTAIDAFHRDHEPRFLADAMVSQPRGNRSAGAMLDAVTCILSLYSEIDNTEAWIRANSRRIGVAR